MRAVALALARRSSTGDRLAQGPQLALAKLQREVAVAVSRFMNVHPSLPDHPKYLLYKQALGERGGDALDFLMRIWGHCQTMKRGENWGRVGPDYVEAVARWTGEPGKLFCALAREFCGKPGWVYQQKNGDLIISNWAEHNRSLLRSWDAGTKGGRPRLSPRQPQENPKVFPRQPQENPTGLDLTGLDLSTEREGTRASGEVNCPAQLSEVIEHGKKLTPPASVEFCQEFFRYWQGRGWWMTDKVRMSDFRPVLESRWIESLKKPANGRPGGASPLGNAVAASIDRRTRKGALERLIENHPANRESGSYNEGCTTEDRKDLTRLRAELENLTREIAA